MESTLTELAASFQLPALAFNADGVVNLHLGEQDVLSLERTEEQDTNRGVLLSLIRPLPPHMPDASQATLRLCAESLIPLRAGLTRDGRLAFTSRLSEQTFTLQETLRRLAILRDTHDRLQP
jgi:hypothetical protein